MTSSPPSRALSASLGGELVAVEEADTAGAPGDAPSGPPPSSPAPLPPPPRTAPLLRSLRLGMASTYYTMADALGLRKLGDLLKV